MKGFYLYTRNREYFFLSDRTRKSKKLASVVCDRIASPGYTVTPEDIETVMCNLRPAKCEIKTLVNGRQYYNISGHGFGGYGTFVDDGQTVVIDLTGELGKGVNS